MKPQRASAPEAQADDWALPCIRGVQAGRSYFVTMLPLRLLSSFFTHVDTSAEAAVRAQRLLNVGRARQITDYLAANPTSYIFSALAGEIDGDTKFETAAQADAAALGMLRIPRAAKVTVLDGQHRGAGIEGAIAAARERVGRKEKLPLLPDESIAVVLFPFLGLAESQQRFADLNLHAVRPNKSIGLLYEHRDETAVTAKTVMTHVPLFQRFTDGEKAAPAGRSSKLFSFAAVHAATKALLASLSCSPDDARKLAIAFWREVTKYVAGWAQLEAGEVTAAELRERQVDAHAVALEALGRVGNALLLHRRDTWVKDIAKLTSVDWARTAPLWAGRAIINGHVTKNGAAVVLTANALKAHLGLELSPEDRRLEARLFGRALEPK